MGIQRVFDPLAARSAIVQTRAKSGTLALLARLRIRDETRLIETQNRNTERRRELKASTRVKSFGDGGAASNLVGVELGEVRRLD